LVFAQILRKRKIEKIFVDSDSKAGLLWRSSSSHEYEFLEMLLYFMQISYIDKIVSDSLLLHNEFKQFLTKRSHDFLTSNFLKQRRRLASYDINFDCIQQIHKFSYTFFRWSAFQETFLEHGLVDIKLIWHDVKILVSVFSTFPLVSSGEIENKVIEIINYSW